MRIRSIKPEFWRSRDIASLAVEDRLLFVGVWSYVDDNGVGVDELADIVGDLFAHDMVSNSRECLARVSRGLQNLSDAGLITRYSVDGRDFLAVNSWKHHQRIDKPNKPRFPLPEAYSRDSREGVATVSEKEASGTEEQRNRGTGENTPLPLADATGSGGVTGPQPDHFADFWDAFPKRVDKRAAAKAFKAASKRADPAAIIAGARRYASECETNRTETRFIKHPTTWLNADAWDNPEFINGPIKDNRQKRIDDMTLGAIKRGTEGRNAFAVLLPPDDGGAS
ncbi:replication initiation protein [Propionibacterium phage PFR2]|uniref:Uncharacterized protein n=2 Tax=Pulverervirus PFR1 TaxID=2170091 RepID=A0A173G9J5_9CAUD|nr:hypothetical protein [Propionibacterium freudenreichii]YP_009287724.1 replication initiation protein [Propionibacterium phage PFR1]YP_009290957.1 replication initiation protein [Propionibacterium phage PFR2]ANH49914.1 hypothetical protein PFR_48 [Propionibacterium phage PFR1]ANH49972.1 hypothetical protein PFR2_48 [Propionibacterium phage PFR2]MDK9674423.1 hypothetical protein [Propionibacterium freudenreichii]CEI46731.1 Gp72 [Propionibacterium freudenreichii]SCQ46796.1 Hypothetical prote